MKPLNLDNSPCSPISSNCVIWQGNNIPCINLCKGDTVSDVVYKLATELCTIMDQLNISNYDLACLNLGGCDPKDFQALIELLIQKICDLENTPAPTPTPDGDSCCTTPVAVADCFGKTPLPLNEYVQVIGTRICAIVEDISTIQSSINGINVSLAELQTQINDIPVYTLPPIDSTCTINGLGPGTYQLDILFQALVDAWCSSTDTLGNLAAVINPPCTLTDIITDAGPAWVNPVVTLADAINNIWLSICYFYDYEYPKSVVTGSDGITVTSTYDSVTNTTTYDVAGTGAMPVGAVIPWAGTGTPPVGWLLCDGSTYNYLTDPIYEDLFNVIGTTYNSPGPPFFNVPNLQNRIPVGLGTNADGYNLTTVGNVGGARVETLTDAQIPPHTHDLSATTFSATVTGTATGGAHGHTILGDPNGGTGSTLGFQLTSQPVSPYDAETSGWMYDGDHTHSVTGTASGTLSGTTGDGTPALQGLPHGNMQPYIVMKYIIKY